MTLFNVIFLGVLGFIVTPVLVVIIYVAAALWCDLIVMPLFRLFGLDR